MNNMSLTKLEPIKKNKLSDSVKNELTNFLKSSDFSLSNKLPTEEQLSSLLHVSRVTIRRTLSELETEGLIFRRHGQGTFVNLEALKVKVNLNKLIDFSDIINDAGYKSTHKIITCEEMKATDEVAQALKIKKGSPVIYVEYWLYADNQPAIISIGWCPKELFSIIPSKKNCEDNTFFKVLLSNAGVIVTSDRIKLQAITRTNMEQLLGHTTDFYCDALFYFRSIAFNQQNVPVIYGKAFYDTDIINFELYRKI